MILKKLLFLMIFPVFLSVCAMDYADPANWLAAEKNKKNTQFDVFYVHPTLLKDKKNPYPDFSNPKIRARLTNFSTAQAGIFGKSARIFVPAVRQLEYTRILEDMKKFSAPGAPPQSLRGLAAKDTVKAFKYYLKHWNPGGKRPYILFGHSQGAMDLYELIKQVPEISPDKGFTAAYLPGLPLISEKNIREDLEKRGILPAQDEGSTGVVIVWQTQDADCKNNPFAVKDGYGINPLNWRCDDLKADTDLHRGMILYDHKAGAPLLYMSRYAKPAACTAQLKNGALVVDGVHPAAKKLFRAKNGSYHAGDIWMFTGNIVENAKSRVSLYRIKKELDAAKKLISTGKAECVVLKNGRIAKVERGRGVSPLLRLYDREKQIMQDALIVDKVIGRAAAMIAIKAKAKFVYGRIMSEDAQILMKKHNIPGACALKVHRILNRKRDGLCPLEQSVQGIEDPDKALAALRKKIALLMSGKK